MTPEVYSEWLRRQGHKVVRTESSYWHSEGFGVYQAFPYHWLIAPPKRELSDLFSRHWAVALRYSAPPDAGDTDSYHAVYTGTDYDFEMLGSWARKNVRRGLRNCSVSRISFDRYVDEGWDLRVDTLSRQGRHMNESRQDFRRRYTAATDLEGFEVWAAEVQGRLAATLVTFRMDGWGYMLYQQCHRDFLREHVNNALGFVVTQDLIRNHHVRGVFYGMKSLDAPASVDEFKFRMGYEAKPVRQRVNFHPYLSPLVGSFGYRISRSLAIARPTSRLLAKAEGMMRVSLAEVNPRRKDLECGLPNPGKP